jgi:hypothetical protein
MSNGIVVDRADAPGGLAPLEVSIPEPLLDIATGFMAAQYLFVASELGLFEALATGPLTLEQLAGRLGLEASRLSVMVNAATALGVIQRTGAGYSNTPMTATTLAGAAGFDLRPLLRFWGRMNYPLWMRLPTVIRSGKATGWSTLSGGQQEIYSEGVEALSLVHAQALPRTYDFSRHRRVLDLGGGTGLWLSAILAQHPQLRGTLIDLPNAAAIAETRLADQIARGAAAVIGSDFLEQPIPAGHDAVLVANIVHGFSAQRNRQLLARVRASVTTAARLVLVDFWTDDSRANPRIAALIAGSFLLTTGEGNVYSVGDAKAWLSESGWRFLECVSLPSAASAIIAEAID